MKIVQLDRTATRKTCNTEKMQHETTRKKCDNASRKKMQYEKSATPKKMQYEKSAKKVQHENSATIKMSSS